MTRGRRTYVVAAAVGAIVAAANASQGGYFSQSWGWIALAFLVPTTILLILDRVEAPGRLRVAFASLIVALGVWIALSSVWSVSTSASIREVERMLVYVAVALAVALVLRRGDGPGVLAGIVIGVTLVCGYALATRLFPDVLETFDDPGLPYRLSEPVGYWNSLGLLTAMGFIASFGVVAHARRTLYALAAAAMMPVLAATLYFTFSRGAWAAQVFGYAAMVALDPRRLRLLWISTVVAIPPVLGVLFASQQYALTTEGSAPGSAAAQGHRVAVVLAVLAVCAVPLAWVSRRVAARVRVSRPVRRAVDIVLLSCVVVMSVSALVAAGGPVHGVAALKDRFEAPPPESSSLNSRLLSFSGNFRSEQLRVAIDAGRAHPILGTGAGSYESQWYQHRRATFVIRNAHSLYVETFGELGAVGLAVLCLALLLPLLAALRARRSHLVPAAGAAYIAWLAHSSLDWNWELVGVSLTAFLAGSAGLLGAERARGRTLRVSIRLPLVISTVALTLCALVSLVGNQALFAGRASVADGNWVDALGHARKARTLLPWSHEPDVVYGDAAAGLGDRAGAISAYRSALKRAPDNWVVWLRIAQVSRGKQRVQAYERVHRLNPLEVGLPEFVYR